MNKIYIVALLMIAGAITVFLTASKDVTTYSHFQEAIKSGDRVKIVGQLVKDKAMDYDALKAPNLFKFFLKDDKGFEKQVVLNKPKPQDFELSESIVLTGKMDNDIFYADEILMKCPSKYKNEEAYIKSGS